MEWRLKFGKATTKVLTRFASNHHPILILLLRSSIDKENRPFQFEAAWLSHEDFPNFIQQNWLSNNGIVENITSIKPHLIEWNKVVFGHIKKRQKYIMAIIGGIQKALEKQFNPYLCKLELELQVELNHTLQQEEILWFQKSRSKWLT